jgi:hypothetical protein
MKLHVGMHSTHARVLFCVGAAQARNASAEGTPATIDNDLGLHPPPSPTIPSLEGKYRQQRFNGT